MAHHTFKVCIMVEDTVENFYIKHYIDPINPVFNRFKNAVFTRNPSANTVDLKIYWIDAEEDQIQISCEEDFRLYIEQGKGRKIFFSVLKQQLDRKENDVSMDAEDEVATDSKGERKSRKSLREEERRNRYAKKVNEKLKHYEEVARKNEEGVRKLSEKHERKNAERLEKAKRRVEQIRSIIGAIDPANLSSSIESNDGTNSTSSGAPNAVVSPSPETIRLLSNAIAGCLQPCTVINKVLNDVFAMIPQIIEPVMDSAASSYANAASFASASMTSTNAANATDQQQQTMEVPKNTTATNTSDANTPVSTRQTNHEIEALFKEAAKELEKMNEIVNNNKMESSAASTSSSTMTGLTQIDRVFQNVTDSAISNATLVDCADAQQQNDDADITDSASNVIETKDEEFKIVTPPKSMRSRDSSIEVHDAHSMMSDDSRDWTILSIDHEEANAEPSISGVARETNTGAIPKVSQQVDMEIQTDDVAASSIKSLQTTIETQTPPLTFAPVMPNQQQLQASFQKSIDIVQKSIATIQKSMDSVPVVEPTSMDGAVGGEPAKPNKIEQFLAAESQANIKAQANPSIQIYPELPTAAASKPKFQPALIVYDPSPKINAAVHQMMAMGYSNEDNWLTTLLINVNGDVTKAVNFLTPQPKKNAQK